MKLAFKVMIELLVWPTVGRCGVDLRGGELYGGSLSFTEKQWNR